MAFFGVIPFGPEQLERMTGVQDRKGFYLEDDVEEVQDPSWLQTAGDRLGRLGSNTAEGLGMMFGGDATAIGGPDMSNQFPFNVWNPKGHVDAGGGDEDGHDAPRVKLATDITVNPTEWAAAGKRKRFPGPRSPCPRCGGSGSASRWRRSRC